MRSAGNIDGVALLRFKLKYILETYFNVASPKINRRCIYGMAIKRHFPPILRNPHASSVPHQNPQMWSTLLPLFLPPFNSPSFHCKERKKSFTFSLLPASPSPSSPSQQQRGAQSSHTPQPNPNCVCVCLHFSPWHEEGNQVSILCSVPVNGSPEPFQSFHFHEKVENLAVRNVLEFGKFVLWIYINLVWECNGKLGISYSDGKRRETCLEMVVWL